MNFKKVTMRGNIIQNKIHALTKLDTEDDKLDYKMESRRKTLIERSLEKRVEMRSSQDIMLSTK